MSKYAMLYRCTNCGVAEEWKFDKGVPAPRALTCPRCGCSTLEPDSEERRVRRWLDARKHEPMLRPYKPTPWTQAHAR